MPRASRALTIARPTSASFQRSRIKVAGVQGQPGVPVVQQTFPVVPRPSYSKARVRIVRKVDVSKGLTMPEGQYLPFVNGTPGAPAGGYHGMRIVLQRPSVPATTGGQTRRLIAAPSPTNRGGVRNPYNRTQREGRGGGTNRRFSSSGGARVYSGVGKR